MFPLVKFTLLLFNLRFLLPPILAMMHIQYMHNALHVLDALVCDTVCTRVRGVA